MSKTLFDTAVRAVECPNCGGPVESPESGGRVKCRFCSVEVEVRLRTKDAYRHASLSQQEEVARLSRLMSQVAHPVHGHAYDLEHPPADLVGADEAQLSAMWTRAKAENDASIDAQHRLCFLAHALSSHYVSEGETLRARAVLETAVDLLADSGHRHIVRCRLAALAARHGDLESAVEWLSECDEASEVLELDGEYRLAAARVAIERRDPREAFRLLGETEGRIPVDASHKKSFEAHRIAALEVKGDLTKATMACEAAEKIHGGRALSTYLEGNRLASQTLAARKEIELQREKSRAEKIALDAELAKKAASHFRWGCSMLVVFLGAASVVGYFLWKNRPFPLTCENYGTLEIDGRTATLDGGTLIHAGAECVVTIKNATLRGDRIIDAEDRARIIIKDSVIQADRTAIVLKTGSEVTIEGSRISASTAVVGAWGTKISLRNTTLETKEEAFDLAYGARVSLEERTKISAGEGKGARAIVAEHDLELRTRDSEIEGGRILVAGYGAKVDVRQSKLTARGTEPAFGLGYGASFRLTETRVEAKGPLCVSDWGAKVSLDDVKFTGGTASSFAIDVTYDAEIKLAQSTLSSAGSGVRTQWGSTLSLEKDSKLTAALDTLEMDYDAKIKLDKSSVKSTRTAIRADRQAKLHVMNGAVVEGAEGIQVGPNSEVTVDRATVRADSTAIAIGRDSSVILNHAEITSKDVSVDVGQNGNFLNTDSKIVGRRVGHDRLR